MSQRDYGGDEDEKLGELKKVFDEFDCPECDANNPYGDGFRAGDDVRCYYCGSIFQVRVDDSDKLRLRGI